MAAIIDGKQISKQIKDELKEQVAAYKAQGIEIALAVIQVGNDPASTVYVVNTSESSRYPMSFRRKPPRKSCLQLLIN